MNQLKCILVQEAWQVELMRGIYNENLDMLSTHPLPYRSYEEQQLWWNENKTAVKAYLYEPYVQPGKFVAFLLLRLREGFCTPTIAIQREEWGSGFGQEIVHDYIKKADGPLAGTQLQSNKAICHINAKVGWKILGHRGEGERCVDLLYHPGVNVSKECSRNTFLHILDYLGINPDTFDFNSIP